MKTLVIATMLLILIAPTTASADRIKAKDQKLAESLREMYFLCHKYGWPEGEDGGHIEATCDAYEVLEKVLKAKGYCVVGQAVVGQPGKLFKPKQAAYPGQRHCYTYEK